MKVKVKQKNTVNGTIKTAKGSVKKAKGSIINAKGSLNNAKGFTLLEVLVAITLTALVLGSLFALQSQSKRLSFKAQNALHKSVNYRAIFNAAWIDNNQSDAYLEELSQQVSFSVDNKNPLKKPEAQITPIKFELESFEINNEHGDMIATGIRYKDSVVAKR